MLTSKARSRAGGFCFLGNSNGLLVNSSIAAITKIIKNAMVSATQAEVAALFLNARFSIPLRLTLIELHRPQPPTPICADNSTVDEITNSIIKQKKTNAMDMQFYWLRDRQLQNQFKYYWAPGKINLANYFTKHHSPAHHKGLRLIYLHASNSQRDLQGYVKLLIAPATAQLKSPVQVGLAPPRKTRSLTQMIPNPLSNLTRPTPTNLCRTLTHLTKSDPEKLIRSLIRPYCQTSCI